MFSVFRDRAPAERNATSSEIAALRHELAELEQRLAALERLSRAVHGPNALGGAKPPPPEPLPAAPRLKPIATVPGGFLQME